MPIDHRQVEAWLSGYIDAWRANEPGRIADLFTADAVYRHRPYGDHAVRGREAIVDSWLAEPDDPEAWEAHYEVFAVDGSRAVAIGRSRYLATATEPEETYHNAFLLEFDADGRCSSFTDYYMRDEG